MKPSSMLVNQLLATNQDRATAADDRQKSRDRFIEFSCGHVVDGSKQLLPIVLKRAPGGEEFEFSYQRQSDVKQVRCFQNLSEKYFFLFIKKIRFKIFNAQKCLSTTGKNSLR